MPTTTTIAAGSSAAVSLAAGSVLRLNGLGSAQIAPPGSPGTDIAPRTLNAGETSFGPFTNAVTVNVSASLLGNGVSYYTTSSTDVNDQRGVQGFTASQAAALGAMSVSRIRRTRAISSAAPASYGSSSTAGFTFQIMKRVNYPFYAARLHFYSSLTVALTNVKASIFTPTAINALSGSVQQVTVGSASPFTINPATSGGGTAQAVVGNQPSDVIAIQNAARTDGGGGYLIGYRIYIPNTNAADERAAVCGFDDIFTWNIRSTSSNGDTTANTTFGAYSLSAAATQARLELFTHTPPLTVMYCGDSIAVGINYSTSPVQYASGFDLAVRDLVAGGALIEPLGLKQGSQTTANFYANGAMGITNLSPSIAFMAVGSVNDASPYTQAWLSNALQYAAQWVDLCRVNGVIPGLVTIGPQNGQSAGSETVRRQLVAATKAMAAASGAILVDRDSVWTDYTQATGGYLSGINFDSTHPNAVGYTMEAPIWRAALQPYLP